MPFFLILCYNIYQWGQGHADWFVMQACCGDDVLLQKCVFEVLKDKELNACLAPKGNTTRYIHLKSFRFCVILLKKVSACISCPVFALAPGYLRPWNGRNSGAELLPCKRQMTVCLTVSETGGGKWRPGENEDTAWDLKCFVATRTEYLLNHTHSPLWGFWAERRCKAPQHYHISFFIWQRKKNIESDLVIAQTSW